MMALLELTLLQIIPISCLNISFTRSKKNYQTFLFSFFFGENIFLLRFRLETKTQCIKKSLLKKIITRNKSIQTYISFRLHCQLLFDGCYFIKLFIGLIRLLLLSLEAKIVLLRDD